MCGQLRPFVTTLSMLFDGLLRPSNRPFLRLCAVHARHRDFQFDFDAEAIGDLSDPDAAVDGDVLRQGDLVARADGLQRADEARAISRGEELFGVRAIAASAAEFLRQGQLEIKVALGTVARPSRPPVTCA